MWMPIKNLYRVTGTKIEKYKAGKWVFVQSCETPEQAKEKAKELSKEK